MTDQEKSVLIACGMSEEEAKAVVREVKIYTKGVTLEADQISNYCWAIYATWNEEVEMNLPEAERGSEARIVHGMVFQAIVSTLAKVLVKE
jgi:hypothetical protein